MDLFHLIERDVPELPSIAHGNCPKADTLLGVVLQEVGGVSSSGEEVASIGGTITEELVFCTIELGEALLDRFRHQLKGIVSFFVFLLSLLLRGSYGHSESEELLLGFCLAFFFCRCDSCVVELSVEVLCYILSELYPQAVSHLVYAPIKLVYPGCFPVGVGSHGSLGRDRMRADLFPWALKK